MITGSTNPEILNFNRSTMESMKPQTENVISIINRIPSGRICTYGRVAKLAGYPGAARQVARVLHSMSCKHKLPWHRVINAQGFISLPKYGGYDEQKARLQREGVEFDDKDRVDLDKYLWKNESE